MNTSWHISTYTYLLVNPLIIILEGDKQRLVWDTNIFFLVINGLQNSLLW